MMVLYSTEYLHIKIAQSINTDRIRTLIRKISNSDCTEYENDIIDLD
jgi:hypothetical protein